MSSETRKVALIALLSCKLLSLEQGKWVQVLLLVKEQCGGCDARTFRSDTRILTILDDVAFALSVWLRYRMLVNPSCVQAAGRMIINFLLVSVTPTGDFHMNICYKCTVSQYQQGHYLLTRICLAIKHR